MSWEPPPGYDQLEQIGAGSQSRVFRAVKRPLGKVVALKAFPPGTVAAGREVEALLLLAGHPHVLTVHDLTEHAGRLWLETDYCPNGTLAAPVAPTEPPATRLRIAARFLADAAAALAAAHARGVVHRDVKPSNLLIDAYGQVRLADFGIAVSSTGPVPVLTGPSGVGSRRFRAPEQDVGPATAASDVFALGVTLDDVRRGVVPDDRLPADPADTVTDPDPEEPGAIGLAVELARLARAMQHPDPGRRPSAAVAAERLGALAGWGRPAPAPVPLPLAAESRVAAVLPARLQLLLIGLLVLIVVLQAALLVRALNTPEDSENGAASRVAPVPSGPPLR